MSRRLEYRPRKTCWGILSILQWGSKIGGVERKREKIEKRWWKKEGMSRQRGRKVKSIKEWREVSSKVIMKTTDDDPTRDILPCIYLGFRDIPTLTIQCLCTKCPVIYVLLYPFSLLSPSLLLPFFFPPSSFLLRLPPWFLLSFSSLLLSFLSSSF